MNKLPKKQQGISLLELMISLTIGLIMLGALASIYITASQSSRIRSVDEDMDETARQVFDRLQQDLNLAGYVDIFDTKTAGGRLMASDLAKPSSPSVQAMYGRLIPSTAVASGSAASAPSPIKPKTAIEIATNNTYKGLQGTDNSLIVVYQAAAIDANASIPVKSTSSDNGTILDCIGQDTLVDNKWMVNNYDYSSVNKEFRCKNQPIVDGIDEFKLRYLVTSATTDSAANMYDSPSGLYVTDVLTAAEVDASPLGWAGVTGIEVCIVIAGEPIQGRLAQVAELQKKVPTCERYTAAAAATAATGGSIKKGDFLAKKDRPEGDTSLYRRYIKILTIPNALYYTK